MNKNDLEPFTMSDFPRSLLEFQRQAMVAPSREPLAGLVVVDETEIRCRSKDDPPAGGGGKSHQGKILLAGAVEIRDQAPGRVRLSTIADFSARSLHEFIGRSLERGATIKTDGWVTRYRDTPPTRPR